MVTNTNNNITWSIVITLFIVNQRNLEYILSVSSVTIQVQSIPLTEMHFTQNFCFISILKSVNKRHSDVGVYTGHNCLNRHLSVLGLINSPKCGNFNEADETALHYLCCCIGQLELESGVNLFCTLAKFLI